VTIPVSSHNGTSTPTALFESFSPGSFSRSFRFDGLETVIIARSLEEVVPALIEVEQAVQHGRHAAGFVSYEAAAAINPELPARAAHELPLVWFGIFSERSALTLKNTREPAADCRITVPELEIDRERYIADVSTIRRAIASGDTYQVNYTARQRFRLQGDPFALYRRMCRNQRAGFCAWLDTGLHRVLSASPELFFSRTGDQLTMKPMKGTAPRAHLAAADRERRRQLAESPKERAENLMIVDLVRNDLATIAETGSVQVDSLFDVETFPTVHQMTSTVSARIKPHTSLLDIFRALFPCGSVTGAPKRRTMQIIDELEQSPRGIYCGAIGFLSPGREAAFSVAIRTAVIEASTGNGEIGIGGGITWDSDPAAEYRECLDKAAFLTRDDSDFQLIESLRLDRDGYLLREQHLQRLAGSAAYFGFPCDLEALSRRLDAFAAAYTGLHKVRIMLAMDGGITLDAQAIAPHDPGAPPAQVAISRQRVSANDPFLYHKTTRRRLYDEELRAHPACWDVIFLNDQDEVTEGCFNTIVASLDGKLLTPKLECGLLPGVMRAELIDAGAIQEAVLSLEDLRNAETLWLVNSVRGWRECMLK